MAEPTGQAKRIGAAIGNVQFQHGGHMLAWASAFAHVLRVLEFELAANRADIYAYLSHQRWRILRGETHPRARAAKTVVHITMALVLIRIASKSVTGFRKAVDETYVKAARKAAMKAKSTGGSS